LLVKRLSTFGVASCSADSGAQSSDLSIPPADIGHRRYRHLGELHHLRRAQPSVMGTNPESQRQRSEGPSIERQWICTRKGTIAVRAITLIPGVPSTAGLQEMPEPSAAAGAILVRTLALGVCGTDREIVAGAYGEAPQGNERLVLGHESLGEVISAPAGSGFEAGDRLVGIVRRPDPVPCPACAAGEWDMCRNGRYTERGIKGRHGFGSERFRIEPEFAIKADPSLGLPAVLIEPASIVAKAWDHIEHIGRRFQSWRPRRLLVTGSGAIGLLAALMGMQRRYEVHLLDRHAEGPKSVLIDDLGAHHHAGAVRELAGLEPDVILECTGAPAVIADVMHSLAPGGIACLLGIGPDQRFEFDIGRFNRNTVLDNDVVFGAVNANRRHYEMAAQSLMQADPRWLGRLISRRVPLSRWHDALERRVGDIKVVIDFTL
jgi:threonine dehydrogenase-like Zn-dependent dehydrogenase